MKRKPLSLPVLHLKAHLTAAARLWAHGLWLGRGKDEASFYLYSPSLSLLRLRMHQIHMLISSDVLVLQRVHCKSKCRRCKRGRWHSSTMFCMSCKGGAVCLNQRTRAARQTSGNEQFNFECDCTGCGYNMQWHTEVMLPSEWKRNQRCLKRSVRCFGKADWRNLFFFWF